MRNSIKAEPEKNSASAPSVDAGGGNEDLLPPPPHPSPFQAGEIVLASHAQHFYEAKVLEVEFQEDWSYFIHYRGWNRSWDEWVGNDRLLKLTEENLQKMSHDRKQVTDKCMKAVRTSQTKFAVSGKKQKNDSALMCCKRKRENIMVKGKDNETVEKPVNISIPPMLRKQLMDDFEFINQMGKVALVKLPRIPSVDDIVEKYRESRGKKNGVITASIGEILSGLCVYFNKALPVMLLYGKERQQYQEAIVENVSPSAVYGAEHLLRLFVKLPELLYDLDIEEETLGELQQNLHDFLKFLQKNQSVFFLSTYHVPED